MKILILIPWFQPAYKAGGPIQSVANMVNALSTPFRFYIFSGKHDLDGVELAVAGDDWIEYNDHTSVWYDTGGSTYQHLQQQLAIIQPDVVFINGLFSWNYNIRPLMLKGKHKVILSARGMLHPGALSQKSTKKRLFLQMMKWYGLPRRILFHATDEEEMNCIRSVFGKKVDVQIAGNIPRLFQQQPAATKAQNVLSLITIALISPMKNHLQVLNAIRQMKAEVDYHICGPVKDQAYWNQCQEVIRSMPPHIKVIYHGDISPDKVASYLALGHVFCMPSKSENFGHSLIEALSAGKPVITSIHTPWKSLEMNHSGFNVSLNNSYELNNALNFFAAMNQEQYNVWSNAAATYARKSINIGSVQEQYIRMFTKTSDH